MNILEKMARPGAVNLSAYLIRYDVPPDILATLDHMTLSHPRGKFGTFVRSEITPRATQADCDSNGNFVVRAQLIEQICVEGLGYVTWLKLEEDRAHANGAPRFEHFTFYYPDLDRAKKAIKKRTAARPIERTSPYPHLDVTLPNGIAFQVTAIPIDRISRKKVEFKEAVALRLDTQAN